MRRIHTRQIAGKELERPIDKTITYRDNGLALESPIFSYKSFVFNNYLENISDSSDM